MSGAAPTLETRRGALELPIFMPDATRAVVRSLDSQDLKAAGIERVCVPPESVAAERSRLR